MDRTDRCEIGKKTNARYQRGCVSEQPAKGVCEDANTNGGWDSDVATCPLALPRKTVRG
jgi:hypothetical protein